MRLGGQGIAQKIFTLHGLGKSAEERTSFSEKFL
jgi:hypothetical protein